MSAVTKAVRDAIECAIANGHTTSRIMTDLHVTYEDVAAVRARMTPTHKLRTRRAPAVPTPGQAALIEAMRIEQAKIYGRLSPERRQVEQLSPPVDLEAARRRRGAA